MIYDVSHRTAYAYGSVVTQSQHIVHLAPREVAHQKVLRHSLLIEPAPTLRNDLVDYFGNPISIVTIEDEHNELVMHARSAIEVIAPPAPDLEGGSSWEAVAGAIGSGDLAIPIDVVQYALASPETVTTPDVLDYAKPSFVPGRPVHSAAWDLTCRIFDEFKFDPSATDVSTPVSKVLAVRSGVCQDFAHVALACLRTMRVPARYVSGYLMTKPPEGQVKMQGADASHAWVSVWAPEGGWVDFDPTNRLVSTDEHVTFAYGREYRDISPISGVLLGGASHSVDVEVDVIPQMAA